MARYAPIDSDFPDCDICGSGRHLCLSVEVGDRKLSICVMCAKRIARIYTRFVASAKSRSYQYWYNERKKLAKAKLSSGLESSHVRF